MTSGYDWQAGVGRVWADEWRRTDRSFAGLTPNLLAAIAAEPGARVLDIGCGAGEVALAVAGTGRQVIGVDISGELIEAARGRAAGAAAFHHADAGVFDPGNAPDLLVSRHGVMFFADPPAVFGHLAAIAAPGARFVFSCFRALGQNPWAGVFAPLFASAEPEPLPEFPAGPFAFAEPAHVERCMAGWDGLTFSPIDFTYVAGGGDDPVADAVGFFSRIGPAAARLAALEEPARIVLRARMAEVLTEYLHDGVVAFPAAAWIVTATALVHADS